jgi:uncharacterized protein
VKASSTDQGRLLDLQGLDTSVAQLEHRKAALPEHERVAALEGRLHTLNDLIVAGETEVGDVRREVSKADTDVEQVRTRSARDEARMASGQGTPKELQALQHELESLARRQAELEDVELEAMERLESAELNVKTLNAEREKVRAELVEVTASRDLQIADLDREIAGNLELRSVLSGQIDAELVALYEKIRSGGGVGAAMLRQRRCEGCHLQLNAMDLEKFRSTPDDEVLRCDECRTILVRTAESGLA